MKITEVKIKPAENGDEKLRAFCSVIFDDEFVLKDLKLIDGPNRMFVAMPSRKLTFNCPRCGEKNHLRANFCNNCGVKLHKPPLEQDARGRIKLYSDVAHPINVECREKILDTVMQAYRRTIEEYRPTARYLEIS